MSPQQLRMQALYLFVAIGCAFLLTVGCEEASQTNEISTVNGQVETEYSDSMIDNGTPLHSTQLPSEDTWVSPNPESEPDVTAGVATDAPAKPQYDLNAETGSDENAEENDVMELRDKSLRAGE